MEHYFPGLDSSEIEIDDLQYYMNVIDEINGNYEEPPPTLKELQAESEKLGLKPPLYEKIK